MQSKAKPLDDLSNLMTNAMGAVKGVGDEVKAMGRARAESLIADMDLVGREEFEVFKALLAKQATEIEALKADIALLKKPARKTVAKKPVTKKPKPSTIPAAAKAAAKKAQGKKTAKKA
ncbi:accessory factor UbiK family protein [Fretibacter rubidus]|uniref:accessory factor UbiK family protein n=1 Tax=Fretibacter rubidus TaxID=570162 RepID=UPI00352A11C8